MRISPLLLMGLVELCFITYIGSDPRVRYQVGLHFDKARPAVHEDNRFTAARKIGTVTKESRSEGGTGYVEEPKLKAKAGAESHHDAITL